MKKILIVLCLTSTVLAACGTDKRPAPTAGRVTLIPNSETQTPQSAGDMILTPTVECVAWSQQNGNIANQPPHTRLTLSFKPVWSVSAGSSFSDDMYNLARPVTANNIVYTVDADQVLFAHNINTGQRLFKTPLSDNEASSVKATGMTILGNDIIVALGNGEVTAVDKTGKKRWTTPLADSVRGAPNAKDGYIYIITTGNRLYALDAETGAVKWNYKTLESNAALFGMAQPAIKGNTLVAAFTTGEVTAFDTQTGLIKWSHMLLSPRAFNTILDLSHISASPVIGDNMVYAFNASGKMAAWNLNDGQLIFTKESGTAHTPILNGNALFFIDQKNNLTAMNARNGAVFWQTPLPETNAKERTYWLTPILANEHILVSVNTGQMWIFDALTGKQTDQISIPTGMAAPIIAHESVLFFTPNADLVLYK